MTNLGSISIGHRVAHGKESIAAGDISVNENAHGNVRQVPVEPHVTTGRKYKSRKERPCDACRKRKICCTRDAYEKDCSLCKTRGETCKYVLPPNVRRNRAVPGSATSTSTTRTKSTSGSPSTTPSSSIPPRSIGGKKDANRGRRGVRDGRNGERERAEWICQFVGLSGDQDPFVLRHCSFNALNCYKASEWAVLRIKGDNEIPLHFTVVPDTHLDARPHYYPTTDTESLIAPHGTNLLETYFNVTHTSYPLLDPSRFNSPPQNDDPLLAIMYNLAAPFCPSSPHSFPALSDFIHQALPIETRHPRLETLEALLLHLNRLPPPSSINTSLPSHWSDIGSLVGMAHDLGLNLNPTTWSLALADMNRRIRIWWGVYIADKWGALGLGRPSYLRDEDSSVPLPSLENIEDCGQKGNAWMGRVVFCGMARLSTILSDLLTTFYGLRSLERIKIGGWGLLWELLENFQGRLNAFHEEVLLGVLHGVSSASNGGLYGGSGDRDGTVLDSSGTLELAFHTCEIVLYRAVLRALPMQHLGYVEVRERSKRTVGNVVGLLEKLDVGRLRAFWWSPMTRINFALVGTFMFFQLLTSITTPDIEYWSTTISHYRSLLRLHSSSFDMTKLACTRMDLIAQGMGLGESVEMERHSGSMGEMGMGGFDEAGLGAGFGDGLGVEIGVGRDIGRGIVLAPGSAEEWIARQGHEGMLLC